VAFAAAAPAFFAEPPMAVSSAGAASVTAVVAPFTSHGVSGLYGLKKLPLFTGSKSSSLFRFAQGNKEIETPRYSAFEIFCFGVTDRAIAPSFTFTKDDSDRSTHQNIFGDYAQSRSHASALCAHFETALKEISGPADTQ
jgi:hypothetical protein